MPLNTKQKRDIIEIPSIKVEDVQLITSPRDNKDTSVSR
jgi:hypothetical protein